MLAGAHWIGVDGGATSVKAYQVRVCRDGALVLERERAEAFYERLPEFQPVALERQLEESRSNGLHIDANERGQAQIWVQATAQVILEVAQGQSWPVAICMPGIKTSDGGGLQVVRNGPRIPRLLDRLASVLSESGFALATHALYSDGDCAGKGEEIARDGAFRGVQSGYYVGSGTGVSEAPAPGGSAPFR